jgi:hypothetical protein
MHEPFFSQKFVARMLDEIRFFRALALKLDRQTPGVARRQSELINRFRKEAHTMTRPNKPQWPKLVQLAIVIAELLKQHWPF